MNFKYIFPLFIALLAFMTSCNDDDSITLLDEIQVSSSYVAIPVSGGSTTIELTTKGSWTVEKVTTDKDKVEWLTIPTTSGSAGISSLTFTAGSTLDGRTAEVLIKSEGKTQRINIIQGLSQISEATVAEVIAGPDGKTFRVTGVCTEIQNTDYGNWILADDTGSLLVYGTLDAKGGTKNFASLGIEVGDEVTVEGPKLTYGSTIELVDVTVIKINKSLVKVDSVENEVLPLEGGEFVAHLSVKGQGISVDIPENAKDWLSIASVESAGEKVVVTFTAAPNAGGDRFTTIVFRTVDSDKKEYSTETTLMQEGAIVKATIAEFLAAEVGDTQYRLAGVVTNIANLKYGNVYIKDFSGEAYVYGVKDFKEEDFKVGDIITIVGKRAAYKEDPQVAGAVLEEVIPVTPITIAELLDKPDSATDFYMVTADIEKITNEVYGNMVLVDGESKIDLYGCYPGYGATGDYRKGVVTDKNLKPGDQITVIGTRGTHNGVNQLGNGIYFSHENRD